MVDFASLQADVRDLIGDPAAQSNTWTPAQVKAAINAAQLNYCEKTGVTYREMVGTSNSQGFVTIANPVIKVDRVIAARLPVSTVADPEGIRPGISFAPVPWVIGNNHDDGLNLDFWGFTQQMWDAIPNPVPFNDVQIEDDTYWYVDVSPSVSEIIYETSRRGDQDALLDLFRFYVDGSLVPVANLGPTGWYIDAPDTRLAHITGQLWFSFASFGMGVGTHTFRIESREYPVLIFQEITIRIRSTALVVKCNSYSKSRVYAPDHQMPFEDTVNWDFHIDYPEEFTGAQGTDPTAQAGNVYSDMGYFELPITYGGTTDSINLTWTDADYTYYKADGTEAAIVWPPETVVSFTVLPTVTLEG